MEDLLIMLIVLNIFIVVNLVLIDFWFLTDVCKFPKDKDDL